MIIHPLHNISAVDFSQQPAGWELNMLADQKLAS